MKLSGLGFTDEHSRHLKDVDLSEFSVGRVTQEHRERYIVSDGENEYDSEVTGNLRFTASSRLDFPAVGDWVIVKTYNPGQAIIHAILPRKTVLVRQAAGKKGEVQIISANIDVALIMQSLNNNFNINRLERYLAICHDAGIDPVLVISKTDLSGEAELSKAIGILKKRDKNVKYITLSNVTLEGMDQVLNLISEGKTYCVMGSSGVGKSTLINNLLKRNILKTGEISAGTGKGRHTTDHRELFVLDNGGIIIDTPGMKELGMTDNSEGIRTTFHEITVIARNCRYADCRHINEAGCAVLDAVSSGFLDAGSYDNYIKVMKEQVRFSETVAEKRKKDKIFGKMIKDYFKKNPGNKY